MAHLSLFFHRKTLQIANDVKPIFGIGNKLCILETRARARWEKRFLSPISLPFSPDLFRGSRFSSRAAFRVFGRALNWAPFKTWELFNAPPLRVTPLPFVISFLSLSFSRVTWLELRARVEKNVAPSTVSYDYPYKILTRFVTRSSVYVAWCVLWIFYSYNLSLALIILYITTC